jgi:hypothetical protein
MCEGLYVVAKWIRLQSTIVACFCRDFSNGYLVAGIFSCYYPQQIEMYSFSNGTSLQAKLGNWQQLERFFAKEALDIPKDFIEGTIHCKPGAACSLIERSYTLVTHRTLKYLPSKNHPEQFNDSTYQSSLPPHARSTASQSVKNNLANTELAIEPDRILCKQKAQAILETRVEQRRQEKESYPGIAVSHSLIVHILSPLFYAERFISKTTRPSRFKEGQVTTEKGAHASREIKVKQRRPEET